MTGLSLSLGLTLGILKSASSQSDLESLVSILSTASKCGLWLPTGYSDLYAESGRTTPVTAGSGDPVGACDDYCGNGNHMLQSTSTRRPNATNGLTVDGTDHMVAAVTGSSDMSFVLLANKNAGNLILAGEKYIPTDLIGYIQNGSTSPPHTDAGSPTYKIDDTAYPGATRDTLHDNWPSSTWVIGEVLNFDCATTSWPNFASMGNINTSMAGGAFAAACLIDNAALGATDAATALGLAKAVFSEIRTTL